MTIFAAAMSLAPPAAAAEAPGERIHDGFYLRFELGAAAPFVDSAASISNGFRQPIHSSARGLALPAGALELGGTLPRGFVLGGRIGYARAAEPVIDTRGERFTIQNFGLVAVELCGVIRYYPEPKQGLHFGAGLGGVLLRRDTSFGGEQQTGVGLSLEAGHSFWVGRQWSLGAVARVLGAGLSGEHGATTLVMPSVSASIALH